MPYWIPLLNTLRAPRRLRYRGLPVAVALCLFASVVSAQSPGATGRLGAFDLEAHRGGRALRPENTLQSFANALSMGVDTLELDMGVTKDGVVVISHERGLNPDLARGPDGQYIPKGIPYVQLDTCAGEEL